MDSADDLPKGGVSPFGHPRINDRSHLPAAFRSVPRPSSPLGAKASTERPCHTHHPTPSARTQYQTAPNTQCQTASLRSLNSHTLTSQIYLSMNGPGGDPVSTGGVSWKRPAAQ